MERLNVSTNVFNGSADATLVLPANPDRTYIALYAKTGAPSITLGGSSVAIAMSAGQLWEPPVAFTNSLTLTGAGTVLAVMSSGEPNAKFPMLYKTYALTYGSYNLTY